MAALHDEAYGVAILESLEEKLEKKLNVSAVHVAFETNGTKVLLNLGLVVSLLIAAEGGKNSISSLRWENGCWMQYQLRNSIYKLIPKVSF